MSVGTGVAFWFPEAQTSSFELPLPLSTQEHFNYYSLDTALGHLVFSLKYDVIGDQEHLRLLLR